MKIHEYQAKQLFASFGIPVPKGVAIAEGTSVAEQLEGLRDGVLAVKAQIHAGGRGKGTLSLDGRNLGGGVVIVKGLAEARHAAEKMLGATLTTIQTGPDGKRVSKVLVEEGADIAHEYYLGMVVDRERECVAIMASTEGGTAIEEVAAQTPEKIHTEFVDPGVGLMAYQGRKLGFALGLSNAEVRAFVPFVQALYRVFTEKDASLAEINPLVKTGAGGFLALDAKLNFDDNALFRHPDIRELRDLAEEEPSETKADDYNLSYIKLDGNIGCLVNGAGLAMATMDIIKDVGGEPANFLDVGGTATPENVAVSFQLMLDDKVEGIFVNVFGGIVRCDVVAQGLVDALGGMELSVPLVVRLSGNRAAEAKQILANSGLPILAAESMEEGARLIVEKVKGA
ncbi:MAG: ADP-forming succinate--CoA ligase subunit beta [Pseudomonadota bacterium]